MKKTNNKQLIIISETSSPHTGKWVKYFIEIGYSVTLITYSEEVIQGAKNIYIKTRIKGALKYIITSIKVRNIIRKIRPDILHIHYITGRGFLGLLANYHPLVLSVWGSDVAICPKQSIFHRIVVKLITRMADVINSPSMHITKELREMGIKDSRIRTFQYGVEVVNIDMIQPVEKSNKQITIISPRNWHPLLNVEKVIESMKYLKEKSLNVKLIVAGKEDEEERKKYERIMQDNRLSEYIELRGMMPQNEFYSLLKSCDILISVPSTDGSPLSVVEGIYCGCVPILSDIEAYKGWEDNYWLQKTKIDSEQIAETIEKIINMKEKWHSIIEQNRKTVLEIDNWNINIRKMEKIYDEVTS